MSTIVELQKLITRLKQERQQCAERIVEIDRALSAVAGEASGGGAAPTGKRRGRKPKALSGAGGDDGGAKRGRKPRRKRTGINGDRFVLMCISNMGRASTKDINAAWKSDNRGGAAGNSITKMYKAGFLQREPIPGSKGSIYELTRDGRRELDSASSPA